MLYLMYACLFPLDIVPFVDLGVTQTELPCQLFYLFGGPDRTFGKFRLQQCLVLFAHHSLMLNVDALKE